MYQGLPQRSLSFSFRVLGLVVFACLSVFVATDASANKSGASPNVLVLPTGPGSLGGIGENVQANLNMGLMSYAIKIPVPQGRNGHTPALSVSYSSAAGAGLMGIGWQLNGGGAIQRLTVRGLPTYTAKDRFYGPSGELVQIPGTSLYRSRKEGSFVRYRWHQKSTLDQEGYWTAEYPDGTKEYYGADRTGAIDADANVSIPQQGTFRWELRARLDRNGNRISYSYTKEQGQTYLSQVQWVFGVSGQPLYQARIIYEPRPDPISDCKSGVDLQTTQRIRTIEVTSEGQQVRAFQFAYDVASGLSRLQRVTQYGADNQTPFPIRFSMKYSDATLESGRVGRRMVKMPTSIGQNFKAGNSDFLDVNGDGLPDVINTGSATHRFHLNTLTLTKDGKQDTHDFPSQRIVDNPKVVSARLGQTSVQLLDINGDGYTDLVDAVTQKVYINRGESRWEDKSEALTNFPDVGKNPNLRFFDYNGDKAIDIISSSKDNTSYWVNDGKGGWTRTAGAMPIGASFATDKLRLIDVNGDGLTDAVQVFEGKVRYKKYMGYGKWSGWIVLAIPGIQGQKLGDKPQFADINGDGLADMVAFLGTSIVYFVNKNGREFTAARNLQKLDGVDLPDSTKNSIRILDINGNGSRDIVWITDSGKITYLELFSERPNLLKQISNGIGQRINVEYGSSVYHYLRDLTCQAKGKDGCAAPWKHKLPMAFTVVNRSTTWASRSAEPAKQDLPGKEERPQAQKIFYHHGFYDGKEKKFRGFERVETLFDGDTSVTARKDELVYNVGKSNVDFHGLLLERSIGDLAGAQYRKLRNTWSYCPVNLGNVKAESLDPPVRFVCLKARETVHVEGETDSAKWRTTRSEHTYDGFGNLILLGRLGDKEKQGDETFTAKEFITPSDPNDPTSLWFLRAVKRVRICQESPTASSPCAEARFYFDGPAFEGLPLGQIKRGNVSRVQIRQAVGKDVWVQPMVRGFDKYGNIISYKDLGGALRKVKWDPVFQRFPIEESVQFGQYTLNSSTTWDVPRGVVRQSIDLNGHRTLYTYDSFGRLLTKSLPKDSLGKPSLVYKYEIKAPISRVITQVRSKTGGEIDRTTIQCYDGLGRILSTSQPIKAGAYLVMGQTEYNRLSRRARMWQPYTGQQDCSFAGPTDTPHTQMFYDGTGRTTRRVFPGGAFQRIVRRPLTEVRYDEEDNHRASPHFDTPYTIVFDGLGRTIQTISMPKKGTSYTTRFAYTNINIRGAALMTKVTFPDGSSKETSFDLLGNAIKVVDPDRSTTLWRYNEKNQVVEKTDAKGQVVETTYDSLGRKTSFQVKSQPQTRVTYHYDLLDQAFPTASNLRGRLVKIGFVGGSYLYSYNERGNVIQRRNELMGVNFDFGFGFFNDDALASQSLPGGVTLSYQRDGAGRVTSVPGWIKEIKYAANGPIESWAAANGVVTKNVYNERLWPKQIDVADGRVMRLDYSLDRQGNVTQLQQKHGDATFQHAYRYDALYRLTQATLRDGKEVMSYGYDRMNNLMSKESSLGQKSPAHVGRYTFDAKRIHAVTKAGSATFAYDAGGFVKQHNQIAMEWDGLGRCTKGASGGKTLVRTWYGAGAVRIITESQGLHTFVVSDSFQIRDGMGVTFLKLAGNWVAAQFDPGVASTFFDDLAPASGDKELKPSPDGKISAADAWLYHAGRKNLLSIALKKRPIDIDMTKDMLRASASRLLHGDKPFKRYYHTNHLGSVRAVTDDNGQVVGRLHYYPYGTIRAQSGVMPQYSYMGAEFDRATRTYRFDVRSFDPTTARWLSPDPAFEQALATNDEFNSYGMVLNNPIRMREIGGTTSRDGIIHFSSNQLAQDLLTGGLVFSGTAGLAYLMRREYKSATVVKTGTYTTAKRAAKSGQLMSMGAYGLSFALFGAALASQQFQADKTVIYGMMLASFGFTAAFEAVNLFRAFRKQQVARQGPFRRVGLVAIGVTALAGSLAVTAATAFVLEAPQPLVLGLSLAATATSIIGARFLMARLDAAKTLANQLNGATTPPLISNRVRSVLAVARQNVRAFLGRIGEGISAGFRRVTGRRGRRRGR